MQVDPIYLAMGALVLFAGFVSLLQWLDERRWARERDQEARNRPAE